VNADVLEALRNLLNNDTILKGADYLGGVDHVWIGWRTEAMELPCVTVTENNETSKPRTGYKFSGNRDSSPTIQIDIWVNTLTETGPNDPSGVERIATRIDQLLFGTETEDTSGWTRVSSSPPMPDPDAPRELHKALRYGLTYEEKD